MSAITPVIATSTWVSFSGRRSTSGSPPSTKKYGDSVLSSGLRSVPDGRCAAASAGTRDAQTMATRIRVRSEGVMAHQQGKRAAVRRGAEDHEKSACFSADHTSRVTGPGVRESTGVWARTRINGLVLHVLRHASQ